MKTKIIFFFFLLMVGVGNLSVKAETDPRDKLEKVFDWHLSPGTYEEKELALQNPGQWIRIDDQRKSGFQRNEYGIRIHRTTTLVRLICYDKEEQRFLYEERVVSFEDETNLELVWIFPLFILAASIYMVMSETLDSPEDKRQWITYFILACIFSVGTAWFFNWIIVWGEIIAIAFILVIIGLKHSAESIKKKKEIRN